MSRVQVIWDRDADEAVLCDVRSRHRPEQGTVVFAAQPAQKRDVWMYENVLAALGKTFQPSEIHRSQASAFAYTAAWVSAENVERLVVTQAESLHGRHLVALTDLAAVGGCDLVLFGQGPVDFRISDAIRNWTTIEIAAAVLDTLIPRPVAPAANPDEVLGRQAVGTVPSSDFVRFRADMRRLMPRHEFGIADDLYRRTFANALDCLRSPDEDVAAMLLVKAFGTTTTAAEQTVVVRATQAAALRNGLRLDVDVEGVLRLVGAVGAAVEPTDDQWRSLNSSTRPIHSAIAALTLAGVEPDAALELTGSDVEPDGSTVVTTGRRLLIPPRGRPAVVAQHLARAAFGHGDDDPFLRDGARMVRRDITDALNTLTRQTGVPLRVGHTPARSTLKRWRYRTGVSIERFAA